MVSRLRFVVVGMFALAVVVGMVFAHGLSFVLTQWGVSDPMLFGLSELTWSAVGAYGLALSLASWLLWRESTRTLALEVADELARVTWSTQEETVHATWVVVFTVCFAALYLGLLDAAWLWLTDTLLGVRSLGG